MGKVDIARSWMAAQGNRLGMWHGYGQIPAIAYRVAAETGGDQYAVSRDPYLVEVGWSQVPLERAWKLRADPFDAVAAVWLACKQDHDAAAYWLGIGPHGERRCPDVHPGTRDLAYLQAMTYSVGRTSLRRLVYLADMYRQRASTVEGRILWVAEHVDLTLPQHRSWWCRQSPEKVAMRCRKKAAWLDAVEADLGPVTAPPGPPPPDERPDGAAALPTALVAPARVCASGDGATAEAHADARRAVADYSARRRRDARAPKAPLLWRAGKAINAVMGRE